MDRRGFVKCCVIGSAGVVLVPSLSRAAIGMPTEKIEGNLNHRRQPSIKSKSDIYISKLQRPLFKSVLHRLRRLQETVGFANFSLLSLDKAIYFAHRYEAVGEFSKPELAFLEQLFNVNAAEYGFFGAKVFKDMTAVVSRDEVRKIPYSGHFLFNGHSEKIYQRISKDIGDSIILTSGVRGMVKQFYLFMDKVRRVQGNLSVASRSLAPPGYSFHGVGDFDVGKVGYGHKNFSAEFAKTEEFKRLLQLNYIEIRYDENNTLGVRYEPWHIKVVSA